MEWEEQLAPVHPAYHHHQIGPGQQRRPPQKPLHRQVVLPITNSRFDFGRRPRLFYCEFDGQRTRRVIVKVIGESRGDPTYVKEGEEACSSSCSAPYGGAVFQVFAAGGNTALIDTAILLVNGVSHLPHSLL